MTEPEAKTAMLRMGLPEWIADFINDLRRFERGGGTSVVSSDVERVTGRPATGYAASLRKVLEDQA